MSGKTDALIRLEIMSRQLCSLIFALKIALTRGFPNVSMGSSRSFGVLSTSKADSHYIHCAREIWILRSLPLLGGTGGRSIQELTLPRVRSLF
jgi:hypothetical protein